MFKIETTAFFNQIAYATYYIDIGHILYPVFTNKTYLVVIYEKVT